MSSAAETQSSFDTFAEILAPFTWPVVVKEHIPGKALARAFTIIGASAFTVTAADGRLCVRTAGVTDPWFEETKITAVESATGATAIILHA